MHLSRPHTLIAVGVSIVAYTSLSCPVWAADAADTQESVKTQPAVITDIPMLSPQKSTSNSVDENTVNFNDGHLPEKEKQIDESNKVTNDAHAAKHAALINKVPGPTTTVEDLKHHAQPLNSLIQAKNQICRQQPRRGGDSLATNECFDRPITVNFLDK